MAQPEQFAKAKGQGHLWRGGVFDTGERLTLPCSLPCSLFASARSLIAWALLPPVPHERSPTLPSGPPTPAACVPSSFHTFER